MQFKYFSYVLVFLLLVVVVVYTQSRTRLSLKPLSVSTTILTTIPKAAPFSAPLDKSEERVIKKFFGTFVTPQKSPIQPERFKGYHTGVDFETFPDEHTTEVAVRAICSGIIVRRAWVSGYGGMVVQSCNLDTQPITVVYGHLNVLSVLKKQGIYITAGDQIGTLGKGFSKETDGERKHLHISIHKGSGSDIRGYVQKKSELDAWVDIGHYLK